MSTVIVYVHGLWQRGGESVWLRRRLTRDLGAEALVFSYPSVTADVTTNASALGHSWRRREPTPCIWWATAWAGW